MITIAYSFFQVHAGTISFFKALEQDLIERLDESVSTNDLLRAMQAFSEVSEDFPAIFVQLETLFVQRLDLLNIDELTCCANGFGIAGFGSQFLFNCIEEILLEQLAELSTTNIKEISRAFFFTSNGTEMLYKALYPRLDLVLDEFTSRELLYLLYAYHKIGFLPKKLVRDIELKVAAVLSDTKHVEIEELQLMAQVFCRSRAGSRDFHKLLETTILTRLDDVRSVPKVLFSIGLEFEKSGLCSLDTLKILKKKMLEIEVE